MSPAVRGLCSKRDSADRFREVKGRAQDGLVIAEKQDARRLRVCGMQFRQHAILASHIVSRLDFASERRAPQHHFTIAETNQVSEVGMTAGELFRRERPCAGGEMTKQIRLEQR